MAEKTPTLATVLRAIEDIPYPSCEWDSQTLTEIQYLQDDVRWLVSVVRAIADRVGVEFDDDES
jgi:hypothetical protein